MKYFQFNERMERMNIFDHILQLGPDDWDKMLDSDEIRGLTFEENPDVGFLDVKGINLNYWYREFNNRSFDFLNSYVHMMKYYYGGIPDDEWHISPGKEGQSIQYLPHFEEKNYIYLYWFGFYMESVYTRLFGLVDTIYHLVNTKYDLGIEQKIGFKDKVVKALKLVESGLYKYMIGIIEDPRYKSLSEFRNNLTHNYRPNQIDSGINIRKDEKGRTVISMGVGNYTPSKEFVSNIQTGIELLYEIVTELKKYLRLLP